MNKNIGLPESYLRIGVAIALLFLVVDNFTSGAWTVVAIVVGLILGVTAYAEYCPLYALFGIKRRSKNTPTSQKGGEKV